MNENLILDLLSQIEGPMFWMFLKLILAGIIVLVLKGLMQNVVSYIQFSINKRLSIGVRVRIRGLEGKISWFNLNWIFVQTNEGEIIIPIKRWQFEQWTLINGKNKI